MENFKFTSRLGIPVELTPDDMQKVKEHYDIQNTKEYLQDTYSEMPEEDAEKAAVFIRGKMLDRELTEEEAIELAKERTNFFNFK